MKRAAIIVLLIPFLITVVCVLFDFEIAEYIEPEHTSSGVIDEFEYKNGKYTNKNISVLGVQYVTEGTYWRIIENSANSKNGDTYVLSLFDLRCLKENNNYNIDRYAGFITINLMTVDLFGVRQVVLPIKTYVYDRHNDGVINKSFTVRDLSIMGIFKIFTRSFILFLSLYILAFLIFVLFRYMTNWRKVSKSEVT